MIGKQIKTPLMALSIGINEKLEFNSPMNSKVKKPPTLLHGNLKAKSSISVLYIIDF